MPGVYPRQRLFNSKFIVVKSVSHMARSMTLFQSNRMNPITDIMLKKISRTLLFSSSKRIDKMKRVVYEYLGTAWARLRGQIN